MSKVFLSIVIPAYNESLRIRPSLEKIRRYLAQRNFSAEVIVVDDGSSDDTCAVVLDVASGWSCLKILRNARNRGKGFSVRSGMLSASGKFVLFTDSDLSTPIDDLDKLIAAMEFSETDVVVGSRALQRELIGVRQPWFREYAGICFNLLVRMFTGLPLRDTQCGFKLFRRSSTRWAFACQRVDGFGFDPEILFLIKRSGGKILELPVRWNNDPASKVRFLRDSIQMLWELVVMRWRTLTGGYPSIDSRQRFQSQLKGTASEQVW